MRSVPVLLAMGLFTATVLLAGFPLTVPGSSPPMPTPTGNVPAGFVETVLNDTMSQPISLSFLPDGSGRAIIVQKTGEFLSWDGVSANVIHSMSASINTAGEQGLLGVAVDPDWPTRPYVYVHYTSVGVFPNSRVQVGRWNLTDIGGILDVDPASLLILLDDMPNDNTNHNGGGVRFGPDGRLYVAIGDDASGGCEAEDLTILAGKILRLNVNDTMNPAVRSTLAVYDNPFITHPSDNAKLVWAYGFRNPFRIDVDPVTGDVFIGDVGQNDYEEVSVANRSTPGEHFGWPWYEGFWLRTPPPLCFGSPPLNHRLPIYAHAQFPGWNSVMGTTVYRGVNYPFDASFPPEYEGNYFFIEFYQEFMRALRWNASTSVYDLVPGVTASNWGWDYGNTTDMIVGPDGAMYAVDLDKGTLLRIAFVPPNLPPTASFTVAPPTAVNPGVPFAFDASPSTDPDGFLTAYDWDFGDGNVGTGVTTNHPYATSGTFVVTLTVTDNGSATDTATRSVLVNTAPQAAFTVTPPTAVNPGVPFAFDASPSTDPDGTIATYDWDLGDGNLGSGLTANHPYAAPGPYLVILTVTDNGSLADSFSRNVLVNTPPQAAFTVNPLTTVNPGVPFAFDASLSMDPDGTLAAYDWDYGDGNFGTGVTTNHPYATSGTFVVTLTVTDNGTATNTATRSVLVNTPPTAAFTATPPTAVNPGVLLTLDASASMDPDGFIVSSDWDFGDGNLGSGNPVTHQYPASGTYVVTVTVTDNGSLTSLASGTVLVNAGPVAAFTATPLAVNPGVPVIFDAAASTDLDGTITLYGWDFGDTNLGSGVLTNHAYTSPGSYTAILTVTDNGTLTDTASQSIFVNAPPNASFTATPQVANPGVPVNFTSTSSDPEGNITAYLWDFGDGTTSTAVSPSHAYALAGTYVVSLTVTDNMTLSDTTTQSVQMVNQPPVASLVFLPGLPDTNASITFNGSGSIDPDGIITNYRFDFGDGAFANGTAAVVTHAYALPGTYLVTLNVTDDDGSTDSQLRGVLVRLPNAPPLAVATVDSPNGNLSTSFLFDGQNSTDDRGIAGYFWDFGEGDTSTAAQVPHGFAAKGNHTVTLTVTDTDGLTGTATVTVEVRNRLPLAMVTPPTGSISLAANQLQGFQVNATDEDEDPITFEWRVDGVLANTSSRFDFRRDTPGTYEIALNVSDGFSSQTFTWTVEVRAGPGAGPQDWSWVLWILLVVLAIFLLLFLAWRRRKKPEDEEAAVPSPSTDTATSEPTLQPTEKD